MNLILQRYSDNRDCTLGLLFEKKPYGIFFHCYTLEDEQRDYKFAGETRIPSGFYEIKINKTETPLTLKYRKRYSWFKYHLEITGIKNFKSVYIHIGNKDEDTDGCILVGDNADNNRIGYGSISNSTQAFCRLYKYMYDHLETNVKCFIEIRDEKNLV